MLSSIIRPIIESCIASFLGLISVSLLTTYDRHERCSQWLILPTIAPALYLVGNIIIWHVLLTLGFVLVRLHDRWFCFCNSRTASLTAYAMAALFFALSATAWVRIYCVFCPRYYLLGVVELVAGVISLLAGTMTAFGLYEAMRNLRLERCDLERERKR